MNCYINCFLLTSEFIVFSLHPKLALSSFPRLQAWDNNIPGAEITMLATSGIQCWEDAHIQPALVQANILLIYI